MRCLTALFLWFQWRRLSYLLHTPYFQVVDIDIEPTLRPYRYKENGIISVTLSNVTTRTITIPPKAIICEVQPVTIEATPKQTSMTDNSKLLEELDITKVI